MTFDNAAAADTPRRAVLGVAVATGALCAGCTAYGTKAAGPAIVHPATAPAASEGGSAPAAPVALAASSAVPVGGGLILTDRQIVLSQPTAGAFKAFTAVCTHQGCTVSSISNGIITCPCHGSRFHLTDGSVGSGPATQPLAPVAIKVVDGQITLA